MILLKILKFATGLKNYFLTFFFFSSKKSPFEKETSYIPLFFKVNGKNIYTYIFICDLKMK